MKYILAIDQSTSCTKAMLFDEQGNLSARKNIPHRQYVNEKGWIEHDVEEIYHNLIMAVRGVVAEVGPNEIVAAGLANQRETTVVWNRKTGKPLYRAIVWQCGRARDICDQLQPLAPKVKEKTGMPLSPFFSAAKVAWIKKHVGFPSDTDLVASTIDCFIVNRLSGGREVKTDFSNACRTQLFNIHSLQWDKDLLDAFGLDGRMMPEVCDSDSMFCETDFEGCLPRKIPLHCILGDSQSALFAQGCLSPGMVKATYGTGSSVMMNIGEAYHPTEMLVTSIAWKIRGSLAYVVEGNINYSGALTQWLVDDLALIKKAGEAGKLATTSKPLPEGFYIVPAFSGLGAPYWDSNARAAVLGMDRTVGKAEFVRATEEAIAYQITDILEKMKEETGIPFSCLHVDGGPTRDSFLMQIQSDIAQIPLRIARIEELSALGVAMAAGIAIGFYSDKIFSLPAKREYRPNMKFAIREKKYEGWKKAVSFTRSYCKDKEKIIR